MIEEISTSGGYSTIHTDHLVEKINLLIRAQNAMERQPTGTEHTQLASCHSWIPGSSCKYTGRWVCQDQCCTIPMATSKRVR
jgi:hypothetical protein